MKKTLLLLFLSLFLPRAAFASTYLENFDSLDTNKWEVWGKPNSVYAENGLLKISPPNGVYSSYIRNKIPIIENSLEYTIALRLRYSELNFAGSGVVFGDGNPDYPVEFTDPVNSRIFTIWQDSASSLVGVFNKYNNGIRNFFNISPNFEKSFHEYKIIYKNGEYSFYFDNIKKYSNSSQRVINSVWFGNPGPADSEKAWNKLEIDYLSIDYITAPSELIITSSYGESFDQLPIDRESLINVQVVNGGEPVGQGGVSARIVTGAGRLDESSGVTDEEGKVAFKLTPLAEGDVTVRVEYEGISQDIVMHVYRPPVVIVPGHGASYSGKEIMGKEEDVDSWHWFTQFALNGWDETLDLLEHSGYADGQNYTVAFYDWRKSLINGGEVARTRFVQPAIDRMLSGRPSGQKVNILAHSFGGLVSRSIIETSNYSDKINRLVTFGTPHRGSTSAYYSWEGGVAAPMGDAFYRSAVFALNKYVQKTFLYANPAQALRATIPSVQETFPAYEPYVYRGGQTIFNSGLMVAKNPLLEDELKVQNFLQKLEEKNIAFTNVLSATEDTVGTISVGEMSGGLMWEDGKPKSWGKVLGDNTVEAGQALMGDDFDKYVQGGHGDTPDRGRLLVRDLFKLADYVPTERKVPTRMMTVMMLSPAYAQVFDASGIQVNDEQDLEDGEHLLVYVENPVDGEYTVKVVGTGNGSYEMYVNVADNGRFDEFSVSGNIKEGEIQQYILGVGEGYGGLNRIVRTSFVWNLAKVAVRKGLAYSTLEIALPSGVVMADLNFDTVKVNGVELKVNSNKSVKKAKAVEIEVNTMALLKALDNKVGSVNVKLLVEGESVNIEAVGGVKVPASLKVWMK